MTSPLEIMIAIHYYAHSGPYAPQDPLHANSPAVKAIKAYFVERGYFKPCESGERDYDDTGGCAAWVKELCKTPQPVLRWIPEQKA